VLAEWFNPANLSATVDALLAAQDHNDATNARIAAARDQVRHCDERLQRHLDALEAGADPATIASRINAIKAEKEVAQNVIDGHRARIKLSPTDLLSLLTGISDWVTALDKLSPTEKQELYAELGLSLTYDPEWELSCGRVPSQAVYSGWCRRGDLAQWPPVAPAFDN